MFNLLNLRRRLLLTISLVIFCSLPGCDLVSFNIVEGNHTGAAPSFAMVTQPPFPTATATPFLPIDPTPTYIPTPFPTREPTPIPQPNTNSDNLPDVKMPKGQVNIIIFGSDRRKGDSGFRTDVILLLSLNPRKGTASLVSFPRDLYLNIPGYGMNRINTAQYWGFATTQRMFQESFGVNIHHYILTDFSSFIEIINILGGIDVQVEKNLTDTCNLAQGTNGYCSVGPGMVHMNGNLALWYARSRYSTSDYDRTRRAQELIIAIFHKIMQLDGLTKIPQIYKRLRDGVETDMNLTDIIALSPLAPTLFNNPEHIRRFSIGRAEVFPTVTEGGAQVSIPNFAAINQILSEALGNK